MKKKDEKEFQQVIKKAASIISKAENQDDAGKQIRQLSRRERRLIMKSEKEAVAKKAKEIEKRDSGK